MKELIAAIKRAPKRAASLAIIAAAVLVPAALFAWGPDRQTFTMDNPAPYVTFNSITDNPQHGDERNFVQIKDASAPNSAYGENVTLTPGKDYEVFVFYHNNAASNLNDAAHDYKGIAKNAFMRVQMPASVAAGQQARFTAFVGAENSNPGQVWDEAYGSASGNYALRYVPGSATIYSNGAVNGKTLPDSLYTSGTPLGYDKLDGTLPGCNQYAGYVTFKVHVDQPNFEVQKTVSKAGENKYSEQVTTTASSEVEYKIQYKNTGTTQQNDVIIKDQLPAGVTYVSDSTQVATSATNGQWTPIASNEVVGRGINIGSYAPGGNAYVKFKAKVTDRDKLEKCGVNTFVNTATAETNNGSKSDTANVVVDKTCVEFPKYKCDNLTVAKIDRTHFKFSTEYTVVNATLKYVTYVVRDESGKEIARTTDPNFTRTITGKYTVEAFVTVQTPDHQLRTVTSENCKKPFEVTEVPEAKYTCDSLTVSKIDRTHFTFDTKYTVKNATFKSVTYIIRDESGKEIDRTSNTSYTQETVGKYTVEAIVTVTVNGQDKTATSENCKKPFEVTTTPPEECKPGIPVGDERCNECKPGIPVGDERCNECKPGIPMGDERCEEQPPEECVPSNENNNCGEVPTELPHTGTSDSIIALIGIGSLIASVGYYITSRRALS